MTDPAARPSVPVTRFVVVNSFAGNHQAPAFAAWLKGTGYDVAFISECNPAISDAITRTGGHVFHGAPSKVGRREVAVVLRRLPDKGKVRFRQRRLTQFVSHPFAPDRWATRVAGAVVLYALHANAVIQNGRGQWAGNEGASVWRTKGYPTLAKMLGKDVTKGRPVAAGGDMNADTGPIDGPDPGRFFKSAGLATEHTGLMWFAYTPDHFTVDHVDVLPTPPGADAHKVLVVDLVPR